MNAVAAANCPAYDLTPVAQALLVIADAMMSDGRVNVLDASERETLEAALTRTMQGEIYGTGLADLLGTIVVRLAKPYRKPRVVAEGEDLYRVSFNDAVTWTVAYAVNSYGDLEWTATGSYSDLTFAWLPSPTPSFRASSADEAFGTIAGYYLNAPVWGELADVHALAEKCEHDRTLYTKTIKRIAKQRFNVKLSARGSRGTGYSWVYIDVARDDNSAGAHALMQALHCVTRYASIQRSVTTSPCRGERFATICALAGHPTPEGFTVQAPYWD